MTTVLDANQPPERFYRGGELIARFRGVPASSDRVPEDWVASTTALAGHDSIGLTVLPDGTRLVDAVIGDPETWLGPDHVASFGTDTRLLVKLLHAGQRLPVHAHPDREFARRLLRREHGKVEAWHILQGGEIYLGLRGDVDVARLADIVEAQDTVALLGLLNRRTVVRGDTVYVPAGTLHAIGPGILLAELQEPEDLSILLEWRGFELDGARDGHLGLGFDRALEAVDGRALSEGDLDALISSDAWGSGALPPAATEYFRLERYRIAAPAPVRVEPGFAVMIVTRGAVVASSTGGVVELPTGSTAVVPWSDGITTLTGSGEVLVARPPAPPG